MIYSEFWVLIWSPLKGLSHQGLSRHIWCNEGPGSHSTWSWAWEIRISASKLAFCLKSWYSKQAPCSLRGVTMILNKKTILKLKSWFAKLKTMWNVIQDLHFITYVEIVPCETIPWRKHLIFLLSWSTSHQWLLWTKNNPRKNVFKLNMGNRRLQCQWSLNAPYTKTKPVQICSDLVYLLSSY